VPGVFSPRVQKVTHTIHDPHPVAVWMATALGNLYGRGINGHTGAFCYGGGQAANRTRFSGYAYPAQGFVGWNPRRVAAGHLATGQARLPTTSPQDPTDNPLINAVATINAGAGYGY